MSSAASSIRACLKTASLALCLSSGLVLPAAAIIGDDSVYLDPESVDPEIQRLHNFVHCVYVMALAREYEQLSDARMINGTAGFTEEIIDVSRVPNWIQHRNRWVDHHERGHCLDRDLFKTATSSEYRLHLSEAYSDSFAALMLYIEVGNLRAVQEVSDLRAISVLTWPLAGAHDHAKWARYHTAPVLDHTISWIDANASSLEGLEEREVYAIAQELVHEATVSEDDYAILIDGIRGTHLISSEELPGAPLIAWDTAFLVEDATRIELAFTRLGITNETLQTYVESQEAEASER